MDLAPRYFGHTKRIVRQLNISGIWQSEAKLSVFLAILVFFSLVLPVLGFAHESYQLYGSIAFTVMVMSGVAIAWGHTRLLVFVGLVGLASIVTRWLNQLLPSPNMQLWADAWSLVAILGIAWILLLHVFHPGKVGLARIQAAIAAYLLFGAVYAHGYHITEVLQPGSFNTHGTMSNVSDWMYYSFSTLTTLGYGDITAVRPIARMLSVAEALTGQFYMAILIARLVALEVVSSRAATAARNDSDLL